jgi:PhzF family phenazine biosynthesis protein
VTTNSPLRYFLVDAFTDRPFAGNPAVVIPLSHWPAADWLQDTAREMNQSETAFLVPQSDHFELRWFTPAVEVDLCGHATLASAMVLWHQKLASVDAEIAFSTRSGNLRAKRVDQRIELDFPLKPEQQASAPEGLVQSLGVEPVYVGNNGMDYLVEVESESVVRELQPDLTSLSRVRCRGIIVTARADRPPYDFVSRFFAPAAGINEDPVTGSAHCCLADFWRKRLGRSEFLAYQASPRGGVIHVRIVGDRVLLGGQAVLVATGELFV